MNEAVLRTILHRVRGTDEGVSADSREIAQAESQPVSAEGLAVSVLAEHEPDEVSRSLAVWRKVFGMQFDRRRVEAHLEELRAWQNRWLRKSL